MFDLMVPSGCLGLSQADLGDLDGLAAGLTASTTGMIDGLEFDGAKAYKDSKVPAHLQQCTVYSWRLSCTRCLRDDTVLVQLRAGF